jgi:tetratricopeptide (TPR) repeat protein
MMLAGCAGQGAEHDGAWRSIVAEDYSSARAQYESILAADPDNPYANLNLGVAYEELGDTALAAKHYQVAIASGTEAQILEVAQDGNTAGRSTTVKQVATENLARLGG